MGRRDEKRVRERVREREIENMIESVCVLAYTRERYIDR